MSLPHEFLETRADSETAQLVSLSFKNKQVLTEVKQRNHEFRKKRGETKRELNSELFFSGGKDDLESTVTKQSKFIT